MRAAPLALPVLSWLFVVSCAAGTPTAAMSPTPSPSALGSPTPADPNLPHARGYHSMFSLGAGRGIVLVAGETAPPPAHGKILGDVWVYRTGAGWKAGKTGTPRDGMWGYSSRAQRLFLLADIDENFDGLHEAWTYDPAKEVWKSVSVSGAPSTLLEGAAQLAYDSESDRFVLLTGTAETWAYDLRANRWTNMKPRTAPPARDWGGIAYDPNADRVVLFGGGIEDAGQSDTWTYDLNHNTWRRMNPATSPPGRMYTSIAYDPASKRLVMFGGVSRSKGAALGDTWAYDVRTDTWSNLSPSGAPSARAWHAMAYDADTKTFVLFGGGEDRLAFKNDTWVYDPAANTWKQV